MEKPISTGRRGYLFAVTTWILGGKLQLNWAYSSALHHSETAEKLADDFVESLRSLITLSSSTEAARFAPSDFPLAGLDEKGVSELEYSLAETDDSGDGL